MERLKCLDWFQKGVLLILAAMTLLFAVLYPVVIGRVGYEYRDAVLIPAQSGGGTVYSGKLGGTPASFTVTDDSVEFRYGDKVYGPYTVVVDPSAIPEDMDPSDNITGVELLCGGEVVFRGCVRDFGDQFWLYDEDGQLHGLSISAWTGSGTIEMDGEIIDPMEPSAYTILELMRGPELGHNGDWAAFLGGLVICVINALSIIFVDELFRWRMQFSIRDAELAEPSEWELAGRYIGWTLVTVAALVLYIMGLQ